MSCSRMSYDGRTRRQPAAAGRSNFVQTCNLLSRYIKEKGSLRDLNLEFGGKVETLQAIVKCGSSHDPASASPTIINDHHVSTNERNSAQPSVEKPSILPPISPICSKEDPKPSQLTIFYSGRVFVFDDYPYARAQELMSFARNEPSNIISHATLSNAVIEKSSTVVPVGRLPPPANTSSTTTEANGSDLPIARRSSLHRFLEKRKDRAGVRGPYQYNQVQEHPDSSAKGDEHLQLKL